MNIVINLSKDGWQKMFCRKTLGKNQSINHRQCAQIENALRSISFRSIEPPLLFRRRLLAGLLPSSIYQDIKSVENKSLPIQRRSNLDDQLPAYFYPYAPAKDKNPMNHPSESQSRLNSLTSLSQPRFVSPIPSIQKPAS